MTFINKIFAFTEITMKFLNSKNHTCSLVPKSYVFSYRYQSWYKRSKYRYQKPYKLFSSRKIFRDWNRVPIKNVPIALTVSDLVEAAGILNTKSEPCRSTAGSALVTKREPCRSASGTPCFVGSGNNAIVTR